MPMSLIEKMLRRGRPTLLPATVGGNFYYADWSGAYEQKGLWGILQESLRAASGLAAWPFWIPIDMGWIQEDIVHLLGDHGVVTWGWFLTWNDEYSFQVKKRQAHWAQYVMLRAGVPLSGKLLAGSRAGVDECGNLTIGCSQTEWLQMPSEKRYAAPQETLDRKALADLTDQPVDNALSALNRYLDL